MREKIDQMSAEVINEIAFRFKSYIQLFAVHLASFPIDTIIDNQLDEDKFLTISCMINGFSATATFVILVMEEQTWNLILSTFFPARFNSMKLVESDEPTHSLLVN